MVGKLSNFCFIYSDMRSLTSQIHLSIFPRVVWFSTNMHPLGSFDLVKNTQLTQEIGLVILGDSGGGNSVGPNLFRYVGVSFSFRESVGVQYRRMIVKGLLRYWLTIRRIMKVRNWVSTFHQPWETYKSELSEFECSQHCNLLEKIGKIICAEILEISVQDCV